MCLTSLQGATKGQQIERLPFCFLSGQLTRFCIHCHTLACAGGLRGSNVA